MLTLLTGSTIFNLNHHVLLGETIGSLCSHWSWGTQALQLAANQTPASKVSCTEVMQWIGISVFSFPDACMPHSLWRWSLFVKLLENWLAIYHWLVSGFTRHSICWALLLELHQFLAPSACSHSPATQSRIGVGCLRYLCLWDKSKSICHRSMYWAYVLWL